MTTQFYQEQHYAIESSIEEDEQGRYAITTRIRPPVELSQELVASTLNTVVMLGNTALQLPDKTDDLLAYGATVHNDHPDYTEVTYRTLGQPETAVTSGESQLLSLLSKVSCGQLISVDRWVTETPAQTPALRHVA